MSKNERLIYEGTAGPRHEGAQIETEARKQKPFATENAEDAEKTRANEPQMNADAR